MKSLWINLILVAALIVAANNPSMAQTPEQLYQKGLMKEEGEGALQDAIDLYSQIADNSNADQSLRAKALLHIGMCHEKLGTQEAVKAYQRLVNNFPTQKNEVAIARERLIKLMPEMEIAEEPEGITIKQVWTGSEVDNCGTVSLDGNLLSFVDWETGDLAVRKLRTKENNRLTQEGTWDDPMHFAVNNVISPDGKQIVYSWYNDKETYDLKLINLDNKTQSTLNATEIDEEIYPVAWFSDCDKIIVQKFKNLNNKYEWQLSSLNTTTRELEILKDFNTPFMTNLSISQNDKYIAYDFPNPDDNGKFDINLMSTDGSGERSLVKHPANDRLLGWLPGRDELLFISDRSGTTDVWALNTTNDRLSEGPKRILINIGDIEPRGFTRDGSLYYSIMHRKFESFIVPIDPGTGHLSMNSRTPLLGSIGDVCWLPDGESMICVQLLQKPDNRPDYRLCILNTRTGTKRNLANNIIVNGMPRLSPDNKSVLLFGIDEKELEEKDYKGGIYSVDIKTGLPDKIKVKQDVSRSYSVDWDKKGESIFYTSNNQIIRHNIKTGEENILYADEYLGITTIRRSYEGDHLLFDVQVSDNEKHLKSIPAEGGEDKIISKFNTSGTPLMYKKITSSPGGEYIYFTIDSPEIGSILWQVPAKGGEPKKIWQSKDRIAGISVHPDGKRMTLSVYEQGVEIRVMENLGREVAEVFNTDE